MELWSAFVLGIAGSLHCALMCGPLVLALEKARGGSNPFLKRLTYHLGRILAYTILGLVFGLMSHSVVASRFQRWLSIAIGLVLLAGLILPMTTPCSQMILKSVGLLKHSMQWLLRKDSLGAQFLTGTLNGFLPCGLVYVAAAGAMVVTHPLHGAAYMVCFGMGTVPLMLGLHHATTRLKFAVRFPLGQVTRAAVLFMATLLILRGLELGIPFLSPAFSGSGTRCDSCH